MPSGSASSPTGSTGRERPLLVLGPEVDRAGGWDAGIAFAEKLGAPVRGSALTDRVSFPEDHPLYAGPMPMTIAEVNQVVHGHDLVIVIGAQVFRYYPYVAGEYLPEGTDLLQITVDPHLASVAPVGDSLIGDVRMALEQLVDLIDAPTDRPAPTPLNRDRAVRTSAPSEPLTADEVYATLSTVKPDDSAVVMESTSTMAELLQWLPTTRPGSFFATGSGGIGWGVPGAVGVALGDRERGVKRHIVATIGDGSFQYSIQAIWTAAQHKLPIVFVVLRNGAYAILKSFALLENTPHVPALDLPGLDIASLATGFGCRTANVDHHRRARPRVQGGAAGGRTHRHRGPDAGRNCRISADDPARAVTTELGGGHEPPPSPHTGEGNAHLHLHHRRVDASPPKTRPPWPARWRASTRRSTTSPAPT